MILHCVLYTTGEIPKQVTRRKTIKRAFFNISSNFAHFTDYFKTDLRRKIAIATPYFPTFTDRK